MADLIYTRRSDAQPLTLDNIVQLAPAAFTDGASPEVSKRYNNFDTMQAIQVLGTYGYLPVQAAQRKSRKGDNNMYTQHMLAFAHKWNLLDRDRPEIILYNSHDGKSSLRLFAGMFRGICSNGLVAGEGFEGRMRHMNLDDAAFYDMVDDVAHTIPKMTETVNKMKDVQLSSKEALDFAYKAAQIRWEALPEATDTGEVRGAYSDLMTAATMLSVRRTDDHGYDLWRVFNRTQEALVRGGAHILSFTDKKPQGSRRMSRPVGNVADSIKINRTLWDMANNVLEEVA